MTRLVNQPVEFRLRRDHSANWASVNPILADGEPGLEEDSGKWKWGDGINRWLNRPYAKGATSGGGPGEDARIGDLGDLTTVSNDLIVDAINEIEMHDTDFVSLYNNAKAG